LLPAFWTETTVKASSRLLNFPKCEEPSIPSRIPAYKRDWRGDFIERAAKTRLKSKDSARRRSSLLDLIAASLKNREWLRLVSNAILVWNSLQMARILEMLRQTGNPPRADEDLAHVSPRLNRHPVPNGTYHFPRAIERDPLSQFLGAPTQAPLHCN
jgi:Tn3 transposase DDE domain